MSVPRIPTWQERLKACFRVRHRLLHVFGAPSAVGAVAAVGSSVLLNPDTGLALGALTAGVGAVLAGYYVVAGFDRNLVTQLQSEESDKKAENDRAEVFQVLMSAPPVTRAQLERILALHAAIEAVFTDDTHDSVESLLQSSRADLNTLRTRAIAVVRLNQRLTQLIEQSNGDWLLQEARRMDAELSRTPEGGGRDALLAAREATVRALEQFKNARDKQAQVHSILTLIENNLHEFKLAMELRKVDAELGNHSGHNVSELQSRLMAAGQACDELMGRSSEPGQRRARRKVS